MAHHGGPYNSFNRAMPYIGVLKPQALTDSLATVLATPNGIRSPQLVAFDL